MHTVTIAEVTSPVGTLVLAVRDARLVALEFRRRWPRRRAWLERRFGAFVAGPATDAADVVRRLAAYFAGELDALAPIAVDPAGTDFQRRVWGALRQIPPGRTMSYGELARAIGSPAAVRAVGTANGANPIAIVVPCHRVIGGDGRLSGYAGGVERKRWLLAHEANHRGEAGKTGELFAAATVTSRPETATTLYFGR